MILDRLENSRQYYPLGERIAFALEYLRKTDFTRMPVGRYDLDSDRIYAVIQRYQPRKLAQAVWEAHRRYIDVQYVAMGSERMGYAPLYNGLTVRRAYDPQEDSILYDAQGNFFEIHAGSFAIFTPHDIHVPGLSLDSPEKNNEVCKVVVKCRIVE